MKKFYAFILTAVLAGCAGPDKGPDKGADKPLASAQAPAEARPAGKTGIAARINGRDISLSEVDKPVQLALYDLEWEKYQLRRESLRRLAKLHGGETDILLTPPEPPRLSVEYGARPVRGTPDAPVTLAVFCSFQSSHCARLQPVLNRLLTDNPESLATAYFDFPQGFHRYGMDAANAVRCAFEGQDNWDYLDSVFGIYDDLNFRRFSLLAKQTGVTPNSFKACYEAERYHNDIADDINYARSLGFKRVPIVLVNGLYVKGPQTAEAYQWHIDQELARLGIEKATSEPRNSAADVEAQDEDLIPRGLGYDRVRDISKLPPRDKSTVTLSRNWVNEQLRDETALTDFFYKGDHKPGGLHVLKLSDVSGREFFETMGFRTGDVILQVNGEWVNEAQNSLWNDLRYEENVEVKLMRRGKPVTYYYRFGD